MKPRLLRSTLCLLLMAGAVLAQDAAAQPGGPSTVLDEKAKFAEDYNAHNFRQAIADAAVLQRLHALDADTAQVTAQAYYMAGDKRGCVKYIQANFSPAMDERIAALLKRCQD